MSDMHLPYFPHDVYLGKRVYCQACIYNISEECLFWQKRFMSDTNLQYFKKAFILVKYFMLDMFACMYLLKKESYVRHVSEDELISKL